MPQAAIEIPKRALFKAPEVCEIAQVQMFVLRSWESEFPNLGVEKAPGSPRVYRRTDVERVLRIKHLVFAEGLTLSGARRRIEEESAPVAGDAPIDELLGRHARERLTELRKSLRSLLALLSTAADSKGNGYELTPPIPRGAGRSGKHPRRPAGIPARPVGKVGKKKRASA